MGGGASGTGRRSGVAAEGVAKNGEMLGGAKGGRPLQHRGQRPRSGVASAWFQQILDFLRPLTRFFWFGEKEMSFQPVQVSRWG